MTLRPYQSRAVAAVIRNLHKRPILVAPTGSGKTATATEIVRTLNAPALWVADRRELIFQAEQHLRDCGMRTQIIMADAESSGGGLFTPAAPVPTGPFCYVASIQTLIRRKIPNVAVAFIDECDLAAADSYAEIFKQSFPVVGLTATPFRLDGKSLGDLFGDLIVAAYVDELVADGYLIAPQVFSQPRPEITGISHSMGDFNQRELKAAVNQPKLIGDIVNEWLLRCTTDGTGSTGGASSFAAGMPTICFASGLDHSKNICKAFAARGVAFEHIDGSTPKPQRDDILGKLAAGKITGISNFGVLTRGWDLPSLRAAIIARPTESLNLHLQMLGRVMRSAAGKSAAIVLDHAGNHHRHGAVTRRLEYSLAGEVKTSAVQIAPLGLRRCNACGLMYDNKLPGCTECGTVPEPRPRIARIDDGELEAFDDTSFDYRARTWRMMQVEASSMGYGEGWAIYRFKERFGEFPTLTAAGEIVDPSNATKEQKTGVYERFLGIAREKNFKDGWASHQYKNCFGVWPSGFVQNIRSRELTERWATRRTA